MFWLRLALQEIVQGPLLCLEVSPIALALAKQGPGEFVGGTEGDKRVSSKQEGRKVENTEEYKLS